MTKITGNAYPVKDQIKAMGGCKMTQTGKTGEEFNVYINLFEPSPEALRKIEELVQHEQDYNPNFCGVSIGITIDDNEYTSVTDDDEIRGTILLAQANRIIDENSGCVFPGDSQVTA